MRNGLVKFKVLKQGVHYSIPCLRDSGKNDEVTIYVDNQNQIWLNNRYMGASLKEVESNVFIIKE